MDDLLDHAPCGFLSFADSGEILRVNATLLDLLGYDRDELVGRHLEDILGVGSRIFYQTHLFPLVRLHGRADEIFLTLKPKSGPERGVLCNTVRRDREGRDENDCVLVQVKERQKYEEQLLRARQEAERARSELQERQSDLEEAYEELMAQAEELRSAREEEERLRAQAEEATRAKSQFLAVMSHELRTPLNAIGGYVQLLEMGIHGPVTEEQEDFLDRIQRSQRHLLRLINDLLNLSRVEAGQVDYRQEDVALDATVASVAPMVEPQVGEKGLSLALDVPPAVVARADAEKVEQILLNLLSNAVKFTPEGGEIAVEAGPGEKGDVVRLRVRDTGIGIPADRLPDIFDPFVQVRDGQAGSREGTGLGMSISRDLARGMGGDLEVESEAGVGSTFTLTLPRADRDDAPA